MLRMNNTMLLATVTAAKDAVPGTDFMPLQCDYREKYSAAGRFPGGFTKREGRPGDNEILTSRLVDRALRPLFPSDYAFRDVYLMTAAAEDEPSVPARAVSGVEGWVECFERARLAGTVFMGGVTAAGENPEHPALEEARRLGERA